MEPKLLRFLESSEIGPLVSDDEYTRVDSRRPCTATFSAKTRITSGVVFRAQPAMPSKRLGGKTGGRIAIGRDGSLFMTTGGRSDSPPWDVAQKMDNHLGKIVHIRPRATPLMRPLS